MTGYTLFLLIGLRSQSIVVKSLKTLAQNLAF